MASRIITISLPEALEWKLTQLSKKSGVPKSTLIARALLLLISDINVYHTEYADFGQDYSLEDIEREYRGQGENG